MPRRRTPADTITSQRIKNLRKTRKITQADLAERIGVSDQTIRKYESGKFGVPINSLHALAVALDCCPEYLMDATDCISQSDYDTEQAYLDAENRRLSKWYKEYWEVVERRERIAEEMLHEFLGYTVKHHDYLIPEGTCGATVSEMFTLISPEEQKYNFASRQEWEDFVMTFMDDVKKVLRYHLYEYEHSQKTSKTAEKTKEDAQNGKHPKD